LYDPLLPAASLKVAVPTMSLPIVTAPAVLMVIPPTEVVALDRTAGYAIDAVAGQNSVGRTVGDVIVIVPAAPAGTAAFRIAGRLRVTISSSITYVIRTVIPTLFQAVLLKVAVKLPTASVGLIEWLGLIGIALQ
jgi:hypothetical protein